MVSLDGIIKGLKTAAQGAFFGLIAWFIVPLLVEMLLDGALRLIIYFFLIAIFFCWIAVIPFYQMVKS